MKKNILLILIIFILIPFFVFRRGYYVEGCGGGGGGGGRGNVVCGGGDEAEGYTPGDGSGDCTDGSNTCLLPDTLVLLSDFSVKKIQEIKKGETLIGFNEQNSNYEPVKVLNVFSHYTDSYYIIELENNKNLKITGNHLVFTNNSYKKVEDLKKRDRLLTIEGWQIIKNIWVVKEKTRVYNLEVSFPHNYFGNGILVHNKQAPPETTPPPPPPEPTPPTPPPTPPPEPTPPPPPPPPPTPPEPPEPPERYCVITHFAINDKCNVDGNCSQQKTPLTFWVNQSLNGAFSVSNCNYCVVISNDTWGDPPKHYKIDPFVLNYEEKDFKIKTPGTYQFTLKCSKTKRGDSLEKCIEGNDCVVDDISLKKVQIMAIPFWHEIIPVLPGFLRGLFRR